jgi:hypothetical protein
MVWWRIGSTNSGLIDYTFGDIRGHGVISNPVPAEPRENYYNGDGPSGLCARWLCETVKAMIRCRLEPTRESMKALWLQQEIAEIPMRYREVLKAGTQIIRNKVDCMYRSTWDRPPYEEEWPAVFDFVANHLLKET